MSSQVVILNCSIADVTPDAGFHGVQPHGYAPVCAWVAPRVTKNLSLSEDTNSYMK